MSRMPTTIIKVTGPVSGYDVDVHTLTASQAQVIRRLASHIKSRLSKQRSASARIYAEGHTDSTGTEAYNVELGLRRANGVVELLKSLLVEEDLDSRVQYFPTSGGERRPVASNRTENSRSKNRRVEVTLEWILPIQPKRRASWQEDRMCTDEDRGVSPVKIKLPSRDCVEYEKLDRRFGAIRQILESTYYSTQLDWQGIGHPITLKITDPHPRGFAELIGEALLEKIVGDVRARAVGTRTAARFGALVAAIDTFRTLSSDATNKKLMNRADPSMDAARREKKRWLVCGFVAEVIAHSRGGVWYPEDKVRLAIQLHRDWEEIYRLERRCRESRGLGDRPPTVGLPQTR